MFSTRMGGKNGDKVGNETHTGKKKRGQKNLKK